MKRLLAVVALMIVAACGSGGTEDGRLTSEGSNASTAGSAPVQTSARKVEVPTMDASVRTPDSASETTLPPVDEPPPVALGPAPPPTSPPPTTATTVAEPPVLTARIELSASTVTAGEDLQGVLVVTNRSGVPFDWSDRGCRPKWGMYFAPGMSPIFTSDCPHGVLTFAPGQTRLPFSVKASLTACSQDESANGGLPACNTPPEVMPPLDPGTYHVALYATAPELVAERVPVTVTPR
jgi:hypothetical protein